MGGELSQSGLKLENIASSKKDANECDGLVRDPKRRSRHLNPVQVWQAPDNTIRGIPTALVRFLNGLYSRRFLIRQAPFVGFESRLRHPKPTVYSSGHL